MVPAREMLLGRGGRTSGGTVFLPRPITSAPLDGRDLRRQLEHPPVAAVGDVEHPVGPDGDAVGLVQLGLRPAGPPRPAVPFGRSRRRGRSSRPRAVEADAVVLGIGDDDVALGSTQRCLGPLNVALRASPPSPDEPFRRCRPRCGSCPSGRRPAGRGRRARGCRRCPGRRRPRPGGRPGGRAGVGAILGNPLLAVARHGRDDPRLQVDGPDPAVVQVGEVEGRPASSRAMQ